MEETNETVRGPVHSAIVKITDLAQTTTVLPEGAQQGQVIEVSVDRETRVFRGSQPVTLQELWWGEPVELTYLKNLNRVIARRIYVRSGWELPE